MFGQTDNGMFIQYANGYTVSIIWGRNAHASEDESTAEVALFDPRGAFVPLSIQDTTLGWLSAEQVTDLLAIAKRDPESLRVPSVHLVQ